MNRPVIRTEAADDRQLRTRMRITSDYRCVYGLGERFNGVNQIGKRVVCRVEEKFCNQGDISYLVTPFFMTDAGFGVYIETDEETEFDFGKDEIICLYPSEAKVHMLYGSMKEILEQYIKRIGQPVLPPEYAFGIWVSANGWNCEQDVYATLECLEEKQFPASVMVLEAWSDEATFYIFNGAEYKPRRDGGAFRYEDFDFSKSAYWTDPKGMIDALHEHKIRLVLWQIPVFKKMEPGEEENIQHEADTRQALQRGLCVKRKDGSPYRIPEGHWFAGSLLPDFTNPETRKSWFASRKYLMDIGVDGFKTDGGEFICSEDTRFCDGTEGNACVNRYSQDYLDAYADFISGDQVMFSRAGYSRSAVTPIHWAGDHMSTNDELKNVLSAGLSAAMSGIFFWSFDIGGFAGELPTMDLYRRSTAMAVFTPVMQWHSEPVGGQFKEISASQVLQNERSPWNIARAYHSPAFENEMRYWHWLRMNLLPYVFDTACRCVETCEPMMRPLRYEWQEDERTAETEDEYLFGDSLLVAPLLEENETAREVYLPDGEWYGLFSGIRYKGLQEIKSTELFPVYLRCGYGIRLARDPDVRAGEPMELQNMHEQLLIAGEEGSYQLPSGEGKIVWKDGGIIFNDTRISDVRLITEIEHL